MLLTVDNNSRAYYYFYKQVHIKLLPLSSDIAALSLELSRAMLALYVFCTTNAVARTSENCHIGREKWSKNTATTTEERRTNSLLNVFMLQRHSLQSSTLSLFQLYRNVHILMLKYCTAPVIDHHLYSLWNATS